MNNLQKRVTALINKPELERITDLQSYLFEIQTEYHEHKNIHELALAKMVATCLSLSNENCLAKALDACQDDVLRGS